MADIYDFSKGKSAFQAKKSIKDKLVEEPLSGDIRERLKQRIRQYYKDSGEEYKEPALEMYGQNVKAVWKKLVDTFSVTNEFTKAEALNVIKEYFDNLIDGVLEEQFDDTALAHSTLAKLEDIIKRSEELEKTTNHLDDEENT